MFSVVLCFGGDFFHGNFQKEKSMHEWVIAGTQLIKSRQATFLFVIKLIFVFRAFQNLFSPSLPLLQFEKVLQLCANIEKHCSCLAVIITSFCIAVMAAFSYHLHLQLKICVKNKANPLTLALREESLLLWQDPKTIPCFSSIFQKPISTVPGNIITYWAWPKRLGSTSDILLHSAHLKLNVRWQEH